MDLYKLALPFLAMLGGGLGAASAQDGGNTLGLGERVAELLEEATELDKAERSTRLLELTNAVIAVPNSQEKVQLMEGLATLASGDGDIATITRLFETLSDTLLAMGNGEGAMYYTDQLANLFWSRHEYEKSLQCDRRLYEHYAGLHAPDHERVLATRVNFASSLNHLGRSREALGHFEEVYRIREAILEPDDEVLVITKLNLATTIGRLGRSEKAHAMLMEVDAALAEKYGVEHPRRIDARLNLGATKLDLRRYEEAYEIFRGLINTLAAQGMPEDHDEMLGIRHNLASALSALGDHDRAREIQLAIVQTLRERRPPGHQDLLMAELNLASCMWNEPEMIQESLEILEKSIGTMDAGYPPDHPIRTKAEGTRATMLGLLGRHEEVLEIKALILETLRESRTEDDADVLLARHDLGATLVKLKRFDEALDHLRSVHAVWTKVLPPGDENLMIAIQNMMSALVASGDPDSAAALLPELQQGLNVQFLRARLSPPRVGLAIAIGLELRAQAALNVALRSPRHLGSTIGTLETRRSIVNTPLSSRALSFSGKQAELRSEWQDVSRKLSAEVLSKSNASEAGLLRSEVVALGVERDELQRQLLESLGDERQQIRELQVANIAAAMPPGGRAVGFLRDVLWDPEAGDPLSPGPPHLFALIVDRDGSVQALDLGDADAIGRLAQRWRAALVESSAELRTPGIGGETNDEKVAESVATLEQAGRDLRRALVDPLRSDAIDRLFVCSDGAAHLVPLDALPLEDPGRVVGDEIEVTNLLSFAQLAGAEVPATAREVGLTLIGGLDYGKSDAAAGGVDLWKPLSGTLREIQTIGGSFRKPFPKADSVAMLTGDAATKEAFRSACEGASFLHVATHGWFAPPSMKLMSVEADGVVSGFAPLAISGLALSGSNVGGNASDGLITAEELSAFDLSACGLAVLSACDTNVGVQNSGLGLQSLRSALHTAGARSTVTSLWKVDDEATVELMTRFYEGLWDRRLRKADALWQAKKALRDQGRPLSHWAGWVLTGDPD